MPENTQTKLRTDLNKIWDDQLAQIEKLEQEYGMYYVGDIPETIPAKFVLVHNSIRPPPKRIGTRGFRAWLQEPNDRLEVCPCGWAPELPEHFRIKRCLRFHSVKPG